MRVNFNFRLSLFAICSFAASSNFANATLSTCAVPLNESLSSPSIDLIQNGASVDHDILLDQIKNGFDSSVLEPQLSNLYRGQALPVVQYPDIPYPSETETNLNYVSDLGNASHLSRSRVVLPSNPSIAYQLNFSLESHGALARNALFRKLGYAIPSPRYFQKINLTFANMEDRKTFLDGIHDAATTVPERWVVGGLEELNKNKLTVPVMDGILSPAVIGDIPPLHWGIFVQDPDRGIDTLANRRSLRALILPLTLLDIPESANMYGFEPAKIFSENLVFTKENANLFKNETTIGDVKWLAKKIAKLTRDDWTAIIHAGHFPSEIEALLIEKTIGRVDQMMKILEIKDFTPLKYNEYLSTGTVVLGKATQEWHDGYPQRFSHGDPQSPLRASELSRFFGIEIVNGGLSYVLEKAAKYLQVITPTKYVAEHGQKAINDIIDHFQNHPGEPYIQPVSIFGGPIAGGQVNAARNIVTGTYYGPSVSPIQLVDSLSATVSVGGFFGIAGLPKMGVALSPQVQYNRSYVHVRPLTGTKAIETAWKDKWSNILVPKFMFGLSKILGGKTDQSSDDAVAAFFSKMNTGEMFIVTDGLTAGGVAQAQIPIGAILGFISPYSSISADLSAGLQYAILSRTTIYKTADGIHVYLSRIKSGNFEMSLEADFFIKVLTATNTSSIGAAHTRAFILPETFDKPEKTKAFQTAMRRILRNNDPDTLEAEFAPYDLEHVNNGHRFKLAIGPWSWSKRENFHQLDITPPVDPRYTAADLKRTIIQGEITKISGSDFFGLFGSLVKTLVPYLNIGTSALGDDPSSNFLGKSKTFDVSTEVEITPSRPNHTFTRIQQTYTGWTISKVKFLKLISKISSDLGDLNPQGGLVDPSEFSQTKTLQAYTILWNVVVYENGLSRILNLLDGNVSNTEQTQDFLVALMGKPQYQDYCSQHHLSTDLQRGPFTEGSGNEGTLVESIGGQMTLVGCATSWMKTIYNLRAELSHHPEVFHNEVRTIDQSKEKIRWVNRIYTQLNESLDINQLINWVGKNNSYFQVRVSGFRTHDENGDTTTYFSNTIGSIDPDTSYGPMSDIAEATKISSHELEARYLSNGY